MPEQPDALIRLLLDKSAEFGDRDDAAIDLGEFDESEALYALVAVASDSMEDEDLIRRAGESIAQVWARRGSVDVSIFRTLHPGAQEEIRAYLAAFVPQLVVPPD